MELQNRLCVVTGAATGIGAALARALAAEGARVVCVDRDEPSATAQSIDGHARTADLTATGTVEALVEDIETSLGPIDLWWSNAGVLIPGGMETPDADWQTAWDLHVMAHVRAARTLVPRMTARGGGFLGSTASAAGLLNQVGAASYGVTKHAAVGLAEWLAMTHGDDGIEVAVLCPQAVRTDMIAGHEDHTAAIDGILSPDEVAAACIAAIRDGTFLILPHATVAGYMRAKAETPERWIKGMRKLNRSYGGLD